MARIFLNKIFIVNSESPWQCIFSYDKIIQILKLYIYIYACICGPQAFMWLKYGPWFKERLNTTGIDQHFSWETSMGDAT
jgi:hypothetical protein